MSRNTKKIAEGVYLVDMQFGNLPEVCAAYLVEGERWMIVDSGTSQSVPLILDAFKEIGIDRTAVSHIFLTHEHADHAGGAPFLLEHLPEANVLAHRDSLPDLVDPGQLLQATQQVAGDMAPAYGEVRGLDSSRLSVVADGTTIDLGGRDLQVLSVPGHSLGDVGLHLASEEMVFAGDAAGVFASSTGGVFPLLPPLPNSVATYGHGLRKLGRTKARRLCFSHFGVANDALGLLERCEIKFHELIDIVSSKKAGQSHTEIVQHVFGTMFSNIQSISHHEELAVAFSTAGLLACRDIPTPALGGVS
jgi:hydroxyacylglutathione hydrolase